MLKHGEFVVKEIEALYKLKKYRTMKRRYYDDNWTGQTYYVNIRSRYLHFVSTVDRCSLILLKSYFYLPVVDQWDFLQLQYNKSYT